MEFYFVFCAIFSFSPEFNAIYLARSANNVKIDFYINYTRLSDLEREETSRILSQKCSRYQVKKAQDLLNGRPIAALNFNRLKYLMS